MDLSPLHGSSVSQRAYSVSSLQCQNSEKFKWPWKEIKKAERDALQSAEALLLIRD